MNRERLESCFEANRKRDSSKINMSTWSCCLIGGYSEDLHQKIVQQVSTNYSMNRAFSIIAEHFDITAHEAKMLFGDENRSGNGRDALAQLLAFIEREDARVTTVTDNEPTPQVTYDK